MKVLVCDADSIARPGYRVGLAIPIDHYDEYPRPLDLLEEDVRRLQRAVFAADPELDPACLDWGVEFRDT